MMLACALHNSLDLLAQEPDSAVVMLGSEEVLDSLFADSTKIKKDAALDIGQDRGLFIVAPDEKMQLRILDRLGTWWCMMIKN